MRAHRTRQEGSGLRTRAGVQPCSSCLGLRGALGADSRTVSQTAGLALGPVACVVYALQAVRGMGSQWAQETQLGISESGARSKGFLTQTSVFPIHRSCVQHLLLKDSSQGVRGWDPHWRQARSRAWGWASWAGFSSGPRAAVPPAPVRVPPTSPRPTTAQLFVKAVY